MSSPGKRWSQEKCDAFAAAYLAGDTYKEIGERFGIKRSMIRYMINRLKLTRTHVRGVRGRKENLADVYRPDGLSEEEIARLYKGQRYDRQLYSR